MLLEFLYHFFTLDIAWMLRVVSEHLLWVFIFAAATVIIFDAKKQFWGFIFFVFFLWTISDVAHYIGWGIPPAFGPLFFVFLLLPAFVFLEKNGVLSKYNLPYMAVGQIVLWTVLHFLG